MYQCIGKVFSPKNTSRDYHRLYGNSVYLPWLPWHCYASRTNPIYVASSQVAKASKPQLPYILSMYQCIGKVFFLQKNTSRDYHTDFMATVFTCLGYLGTAMEVGTNLFV
jgi:hypothetical protein